MEIQYRKEDVFITGLDCFDPIQTFACGQCFRFLPLPDGSYQGVAQGKVLRVKKTDEGAAFSLCDKEAFETVWRRYFDLDRDYEAVRERIACSPLVKTAMECGRGIRILNQDPFETLITFIISANNNGKRIAKIVEAVCRRYGEKIDCGLFSFPAPEALAKADVKELEECGAGYRAPFIVESSKLAVKEDWDSVRKLPYMDAKKRLMAYPGVGEKVANCILLFSLGFFNAFPVDVWIRRVLETHLNRPLCSGEGEKLGREWYGECGGLAQQYLFYEARQKTGRGKKQAE